MEEIIAVSFFSCRAKMISAATKPPVHAILKFDLSLIARLIVV